VKRIVHQSSLPILLIGLLLASCSPSTKVPDIPTAQFPPPTFAPPSPTTSQAPTATEATPAASNPERGNPPANSLIEEASVQLIAVQGDLSAPEAEISGMAWFGDTLFILPQYPENYPAQDGLTSLFSMQKEAILNYLDGSSTAPLQARRVPISNTNHAAQIPGYEGFEAIAIDGNRVFLSIEVNDFGVMKGFVMQGAVIEGGTAIALDPKTLLELTPPVQIFNAAFESLVVAQEGVICLFEANGLQLNTDPAAYLVDPIQNITAIDIDNFEYRFTDATGMDDEDRFWVLNIFMPLEFWYYNNLDPIANLYGKGDSHQDNIQVERLLELKYNGEELSLSGELPIYIKLDSETPARNWEALVRLDDRGFLAVTDTYPETLFAFIANPQK
jgi:hypothetical protein